MKGLLAFPPQWYPGNPYPAVPLLLGQLKRAGYDVTGLDININFFNKVLSRSYLELSVKRVNELIISLSSELAEYACVLKEDINNIIDDDIYKNYPEIIRTKIKKYLIINEYVFKNSEKLEKIPQEIDMATNTLKTPELFYNPELLYKAKAVIFDALKIISLPFAPAELSIADYYNPSAMAGYDELKAECYNSETNMFIEYIETIIDDIIRGDANYIVISIVDITQLVPAFTLARLIKEKSDISVCIVGNIVTKLLESLKRHRDIFNTFCDFLCYGDGENSLPSLAGFFNGNIKIEDVPGLVYLNDFGEICDNGAAADTDLNDIAEISFDGFELNKYFSPEPVLSVQLSKGCYWGKCAFCDVSYCRKNFKIKNPVKAVEDFKILKERYHIRNFVLSDDSVSPDYYAKMSDLLIDNDININIFSWARLEDGFTSDVLYKMCKAGCKMVFWGYESESERVMKLINKGISIERRLEILKNAEESGIWNHVAFMAGFPTETTIESQETIKTIRENRDIINSCYLSRFSYKKNAEISKCPEKFEISYFKGKGEFLLDNEYLSTGMLEAEKKSLVNSFRSDYLYENIDCLWPMLSIDFEHLLLYLSHYSREWVKNYRLKTLPETIDGFIKRL